MSIRLAARLSSQLRSAGAPVFPLVGLGLALTGPTATAETLTYRDLLHRVTDLERLALAPAPGERAGLASSYDRRSAYDAAADRYLHWDANEDHLGAAPADGGPTVLADLQGPGCIWRIWAATAGTGRVKVYLDGAAKPAIDMPFQDYLSGKREPFNRPNLVYRTTANGLNNYTPIPFQKSCRIVGEKDWGLYFQFTHSTFPVGTNVPTFALPLAPGDTRALDELNGRLGRGGDDPAGPRSGQASVTRTLAPGPGERASVADLRGPGAITAIRAKIDLPAGVDAQRTLLRQLALRICWDDQREPAVAVPLGDFFGNSAGATPHRNLPSGLRDDGVWYSYWYMPYATRAQVFVENDSAAPVTMSWEVTQAPFTRPAASWLRFHAKWHRDLPPPRPDRAIDWPLLSTRGRGRFVGLQLHIWNPRGGWWGEGDEKFFIDGEKFPSLFGTGSEDYFGYAWSSGRTFVQALHSQPANENNRGHVSVNRWHTADDVPFHSSFEAAIEKYFPNENPTLFAATVFWYLAADGFDPYGLPPATERAGYWSRPPTRHEPGAIEAEALTVVPQTPRPRSGRQPAVRRKMPPGCCSDDHYFAWNPARPGHRLELRGVAVAATGTYRAVAGFVADSEMGRFQLHLDGAKLGAPVDLFSPTPPDTSLVLDPVELGTVTLADGDHLVGVEYLGPRAGAGAGNFGLDWIKFVPVP